jgi:transposase
LRQDGWEIDALAERFGIGRNTVMDHLKRAGVPGRRWQGRTLNADQLEQAGQLYETGQNLIAVAEQFGVDRRYLRRGLPDAGFTLRRAGQQKRRSG